MGENGKDLKIKRSLDRADISLEGLVVLSSFDAWTESLRSPGCLCIPTPSKEMRRRTWPEQMKLVLLFVIKGGLQKYSRLAKMGFLLKWFNVWIWASGREGGGKKWVWTAVAYSRWNPIKQELCLRASETLLLPPGGNKLAKFTAAAGLTNISLG